MPVPIIAASISLKSRSLHKEKLNRMVWLTLVGWISVAAVARAGDLQFESGPQRIHLIELFTSQGCSSCPPAEAWLSKLKSEPGLWKDFVPLAFHVDYWDRLGWRDPFASKEWTARQYLYSANWRSEGVYTPGFVLDGREWMGRSVPPPSNDKPGVLKVSVANEKMVATFAQTNGGANDLYIATLG